MMHGPIYIRFIPIIYLGLTKSDLIYDKKENAYVTKWSIISAPFNIIPEDDSSRNRNMQGWSVNTK